MAIDEVKSILLLESLNLTLEDSHIQLLYVKSLLEEVIDLYYLVRVMIWFIAQRILPLFISDFASKLRII